MDKRSNLNWFVSRNYWKENTLVNLVYVNKTPKEEVSISIVGYSSLSAFLLYEGLNINMFSPNTKVTYNIFDKTNVFKNTHNNLSLLNINCYSEDLADNIDVLKNSDRILIFDKEILDCLKNRIDLSKVVLFTEDKYIEAESNIYRYSLDEIEKQLSSDEVTDSKILEEMILEVYPVNRLLNEEQKNYILTFQRFNSLVGKDCFEFTTKRILEKLSGMKYEDMRDEDLIPYLEYLSEIEHIRWCNYHYYYNFKYAEITDKPNKVHNCLIPYDALSREEKDKDMEQILKRRKK